MRSVARTLAGALVAALSLAACDAAPTPRDLARAQFSEAELERLLRASPRPALPADPTNAVADDPRAAALGERLFFDTRFSSNGEVSCATCHDPEQGWADGRATAVGIAALEAHTPSVLDSAFERWLFWDGRADSLWAQALQPLEHPDEQGTTREQVAELLLIDAEYRAGYAELFGAPPLDDSAGDAVDVDRVFANVGKLIAAFERTLLSGETPFDQYARGLETGDAQDLAALGADEVAGARLFFGEARCHMCHHGPTLSDLEFHDVRLPSELPAAERAPGRSAGLRSVVADPFNGLGEFSDDRGAHARNKLAYLVRNPHSLGEFKTPGLRAVASTAPYMHTGQFNTLEEVVAHYATLTDAPPKRHVDADDVLVATHLDAQQQRQLVAFLHSLTPLEPTSTPRNKEE